MTPRINQYTELLQSVKHHPYLYWWPMSELWEGV